MKMSTQEICTEARASWIEPTASFITDTEVLRWINMAQADFVRYTKCLRTTWTFQTVANQQEYEFTAALMEILFITVASKPIECTTVEELDSYLTSWRQGAGGPTGEPEWYYVTGIEEEQLGLFRCPDDIYTVSCCYVQNPAALSSISDSVYPSIRETWHDALIPYVEWRGHRKNRSWELAGQSRKDYQTVREEAKVATLSLQPERTLLLSGPEYRPAIRKMHWPRWPSTYGVER